MNIISYLASTMLLGRKDQQGLWSHYDGVAAQFAGDYLVKPKPGDVVLCKTGHVGPWKVAYFVEDCGGNAGGHYLLREIGTDKLCRMGNESLNTLIGVPPNLLLDGLRKKIYRWATNEAFFYRYNKKTDYFIRCGGAEFIEEDVIRVWVRPHIFVMEKRLEDGSTLHAQPWSFDVQFSKKTRLKDIVGAMLAAGFPREWEYTAEEPGRGMGGCAKITKENLVKTMENIGLSVKTGGD